MKDVVIVSACRTAIGAFGESLRGWRCLLCNGHRNDIKISQDESREREGIFILLYPGF